MKEARTLGLETQSNAVDIGVRVESPAEVYEPITKSVTNRNWCISPVPLMTGYARSV